MLLKLLTQTPPGVTLEVCVAVADGVTLEDDDGVWLGDRVGELLGVGVVGCDGDTDTVEEIDDDAPVEKEPDGVTVADGVGEGDTAAVGVGDGVGETIWKSSSRLFGGVEHG